ncbi:unnamed protein product [Mytilus coruscus]|uniref:Uncharacterized protein n=1 Tax=Mytilus coruscus TaxID=42192 RepID=A0A6J8A9Y1_MYTCO|nr:unnamed protein product [Mytilus coruscus]
MVEGTAFRALYSKWAQNYKWDTHLVNFHPIIPSSVIDYMIEKFPELNVPFKRKVLWNDDSIYYKLKQALQLPSVTSQLDQFVHNNVYSLDQDGIDIAVNDFQSCINEAANIALKQRKVKVTGKKKKDKPWYNTCTLLHDLKKSLDHYSRVQMYLPLIHLIKNLELNVFI